MFEEEVKASFTAQAQAMVDFLNTREGLELNRAFMRIQDGKVRRSIVELVRSLAGEEVAAS